MYSTVQIQITGPACDFRVFYDIFSIEIPFHAFDAKRRWDRCWDFFIDLLLFYFHWSWVGFWMCICIIFWIDSTIWLYYSNLEANSSIITGIFLKKLVKPRKSHGAGFFLIHQTWTMKAKCMSTTREEPHDLLEIAAQRSSKPQKFSCFWRWSFPLWMWLMLRIHATRISKFPTVEMKICTEILKSFGSSSGTQNPWP